MYPDLYRIIGITYGSGDNSTTFNLPNLLGKFLEGSSTAGLNKDAGLPNIKHEPNTGIYAQGHINTDKGVFLTQQYSSNMAWQGSGASGWELLDIGFDASQASSVYKDDCDTVQPPSVTVRYMIKAFNAATPDSSLVDMTQVANDLSHRLTREMTPAFNKRIEITTSGTFTAPVNGWYKFHLIGGGGAGMTCAVWTSKNIGAFGGGGGGAGGEKDVFVKLIQGQEISCIIGAGGSGKTDRYVIGGNGGSTSITVGITTYSVGGGKAAGTITGLQEGDNTASNAGYAYFHMVGGEGGWDGIDPLTRGQSGGSGGRYANNSSTSSAGAGGGRGGGLGYQGSSYLTIDDAYIDATGYGAGGGGDTRLDNPARSGNGYQGCIIVEYFDPTLQ